MSRFWLICIFLYGTFTGKAQEHLADSLRQVGELELAAVFYERALFTDTVGRKDQLLLSKAAVYKSLNQYQKALQTLQRSRGRKDAETAMEILSETILLSYLTNRHRETYNLLLKYQLLYGELSRELIVIEALTLSHLSRWEDSKKLMESHAEMVDLNQEEIDAIYPEKFKLKDPEKAYTLSLFFPGIGQMYAGYFFKGVLSGLIQAGLVGYSAYNIWNGYFFTGGMTGVALFYTFYFGGARYAKQLAIKKNKSVTDDINQHLIDQLIKQKSP